MTTGKVRIIGGAWRGRSIKVIDSPGLRPTADRTRETLFNCLGQRVDDLICFDMFAGTGALGFEALSRGAQKVTMIDASKQAHDALKENYLNIKQRWIFRYRRVHQRERPLQVLLSRLKIRLIFALLTLHFQSQACFWMRLSKRSGSPRKMMDVLSIWSIPKQSTLKNC